VFFYRRRTAGLLTVNAGVQMGWITGVIMFAMWSVVFGSLAAMGQLHALLQEQFKNFPANILTCSNSPGSSRAGRGWR